MKPSHLNLRVNVSPVREEPVPQGAPSGPGSRTELLTADTPHPATRKRDGGSASSSGRSGSGADSSQQFPCSKLKLDQLFLQWLSLPESQSLVLGLLEDAKAGRPLKGPVSGGHQNPLSPSASNTLLTSIPPLSPLKGCTPRSPASPSKSKFTGGLSRLQPAPRQEIPRFYFPDGPPIKPESAKELATKISGHFSSHPAEGMPVDAFVSLVKDCIGLPSVLGRLLFRKLRTTPETTTVTRAAFTNFFEKRKLLAVDPVRRMYEIIVSEGAPAIVYDDFKPIMEIVLETHPGLEFLRETPEFQERYAETVICRIFYKLSKSGANRLTFRELRRGDLLAALEELDAEEDINKVLKYFSYEHFYVVYCKFWELDTDHDFLIDKEDLLRYGNHSLTYRIVERIFAEVPRKFAASEPGKMGYEDFIWFILSEEDKTTDAALEYWFRCVDLDANGLITPFEMQHFYEEQLHRMECLSQEPVLFEDMVCQMHDMVAPAAEGCYSLADLRARRAVSGTIFNVLFNLHKFIAFEMRDPFVSRAESLEEPLKSDWDRYAHAEYVRLAMEEEGEDMATDSQDMWDDSLVI